MLPLADAPPALVQSAPAKPARFAPGERSYRLRTEQTRTVGPTTRTYVTDRTVRFARDGGGWRATLVIDRADGSGAGVPGKMFEAGMAPLVGQPLVFRLDAGGAIIGLDRLAYWWNRQCDAMAGQAAAGGVAAEQQGIGRRLAEALRALPPAAQLQELGKHLSPALAGDIAGAGVTPVQPVRRAGTPPFGAGAELAGTRRVWAERGELVLSMTLSGEVVAPGAAPVRATVAEQTERRIDPVTGLVRTAREETRRATPDAASTTVTRTLVTPL